MKLKFKVENGKLYSSNQQVIDNYAISEDSLNTANEIAKMQKLDVFALLPSKVVYLVITENNKFIPVKGFIVRTPNGVKAWSKGMMTIENNDILFTSIKEAGKLCRTRNYYIDCIIKYAIKDVKEVIE